jgi:hypothetical protein
MTAARVSEVVRVVYPAWREEEDVGEVVAFIIIIIIIIIVVDA